ncbi:NUDIX hydrolase [Xanthobacter sp. ZOL 2024]
MTATGATPAAAMTAATLEPAVVLRPTLAASAAVFRGPLVLLARRVNGPGAGLWSLPGGRVEAGETLATAAARELMEEVGVDAHMVAVAGVRDVILQDAAGRLEAHFVVIAYAARWQAGEPRTGPEAAEIGWFRPQEVAGLATTEGLAELVSAAAAIMAQP